MNVNERRHFSLAARTFHSILMLSLILSIAAIAFGYSLYALAVERQYTTKLSDIALTGAALVDSDALGPDHGDLAQRPGVRAGALPGL